MYTRLIRSVVLKETLVLMCLAGLCFLHFRELKCDVAPCVIYNVKKFYLFQMRGG